MYRALAKSQSPPATTLPSAKFASIHVTLSPPEYETLVSRIRELLAQLLAGLEPLGTLHLLNLGSLLMAPQKMPRVL